MPKPRITYEITAEDKSKAAVNRLENNLKRAARIGVASIATAATAAAGGLAVLTRRAASTADNIGKLSTQLGIGAQALSQYQFIAEQTGVKFEQFAISLQRQGRRVAEAAQGTGEARAAIDELGLSAERLNQLDPGAQFEVLAQQMLKVTNETDQLRLAFKLWDSEGVRNLRTIKETGGQFDELRDRARALGAVIDDDLTAKAAAVENSMAEIGTALSGVGNSLLANFAPAIVSAANKLVDLINSARRAAASIGLITLRVAELSNIEINAEIEANKKRIEALEIQKKRTRSITGRKAAAREINEIEQRNVELQQQLVKLEKQRNDEIKIREAQKSAVVGEVGAVTPQAEKSDAEFQRYLETLLSEEQALAASYARRIKIIEDNTVSGSQYQLDLKQQEYERLEQALLEHQARMGSIEAKGAIARANFEKKTATQRTAFVIKELANMTAGVAQHSKTMFKINKVAAIANAIVNTARGVTMALASYPPPLSFAMAAAQAAAGFAQISAIRSQSFSGGGGGTTPSAAGSVPVINDVPTSAPVSDQPLTSTTTSSVINISFNPGISDTEAVRTFITEDLSDALRDGAGIDVRVVAQ